MATTTRTLTRNGKKVAKIKVVQCNLNHCRVAQDLLMQYEIEERVGISVISEP